MEPTRMNTMAAPQFNVGSVLSRTVSTLMKNPAVFFGLALAAAIPSAIMEIMLPPSQGTSVIMSMIDLMLNLAVQGAMAYAVYQVLRGGTASIGEAVSRGTAQVGVLLLSALLMGLGISIGMVLLIVPGVILYCVWVVTIPACVVEKLGPVASMKRSAELTKGHRMPIFGLLLVLTLIGFAIAALFGIVFAPLLNNPIAIILIVSAVLVIPQAFSNVMITIIYYDLRTMKEGVSLDKLANVFD